MKKTSATATTMGITVVRTSMGMLVMEPFGSVGSASRTSPIWMAAYMINRALKTLRKGKLIKQS